MAQAGGLQILVDGALLILQTNANIALSPDGYARIEAVAACLPQVLEAPDTMTIIGRTATLLEETLRLPRLFQLKHSGRHTVIRAVTGHAANVRSTLDPRSMPTMVDPQTGPHSLAFPCYSTTTNRVLAEGWNVSIDSEDGRYVHLALSSNPFLTGS